MRPLLPLALALVLTTTACGANEKDIKKNLEARFPGAKVDHISKSKIPGLFEVVVDGDQVLYSDARANFVVVGEMLDTQSKENLTRARLDKLMEVKFDSLPLDQAIKQVKGNGSRRLAVFSDPDCPYCRKVQFELDKLNDVTIYMYPYPLPSHPDAARKSALVLCSPDAAKAWDDLMLRNQEPTHGQTDCARAGTLEANLALGQKLRIQGTPALIFPDGRRVPGAIPAQRIEAMLAGGK